MESKTEKVHKRRKTGGRQKGTPNRVPGAIKASVVRVFGMLGGDEAMLEWARENRTEFYRIAARLIPTEHEVSAPRAFEHVHKILLVPGEFRPDHPAAAEAH